MSNPSLSREKKKKNKTPSAANRRTAALYKELELAAYDYEHDVVGKQALVKRESRLGGRSAGPSSDALYLRTAEKIIEVSDGFSTVRVLFPGFKDFDAGITIQTMVRCNLKSPTMAKFTRLLFLISHFLKPKGFVMWLAPCRRRCIGAAAYDIFMAVAGRHAEVAGSEMFTPRNLRIKLQESMTSDELQKCIIPNIVVNLENSDAEGILNNFLEGLLFTEVLGFVFPTSNATIKTTYADNTFDVRKYK